MSETKKVGEYEVIYEIELGDKTLIVGENPKAHFDERYLCTTAQFNGIYEKYYDTVVSESYPEILTIFANRVKEQAERIMFEEEKIQIPGITDRVFDAQNVNPIRFEDDLEGKLIIIKPEVLKREYRNALHQLMFCNGGFGAMANARGRSVSCTAIGTGRLMTFYRNDILGYIQREALPDWAKTKLHDIQKAKKEKQKGVR